jgi:hypothetical protein
METKVPADHAQRLEPPGYGLRSPRKSSRTTDAIRTVNLEEGLPSINEALAKLAREIGVAKKEGVFALKLIHGYGSSGVGGDIRIAVQKRLHELRADHQIHDYIFGEDWTISHETTWKLARAHPELKHDRDLGKKNLGITIVLL